MSNTERIAEIRERCEAATPGPWEIIEEPKGFIDVAYQGKYRIATVGYRSDASLLANSREDIPYLLSEVDLLTQGIKDIGKECARRYDEIQRLTAERDKWQRLAEQRHEYIRSLGNATEQGWDEAQYLNHLLEQSTDHIEALTAENEQKTKEIARLAIESVEREKQLAKLEAEVQRWAEAEKDGRLVVLPCWGDVFIHSGGNVQEMKMVHYSGNGMGVYALQCECKEQFEDCEAICNNEQEKACAYRFQVASVGKTVFLTRAEAEAALPSQSLTQSIPEEMRDRFRESYTGQRFKP